MEAQSPPPAPAEQPAAPAATDDKSGLIAAALIATGIGALALGIVTVWASASESFKESIQYNDRVGPLSGKTIWGSVAFFVSWAGLSFGLRDRQFDLTKATIICVVLLGLGYLGTFAPFFEAFEPE